MEAAYYTKNNKKYTVTNCVADDIDKHYVVVESNVQDMAKDVYVKAMVDSVNEGYCYKAEEDGELVAFIYIRKVINTWLACSIFSKDIIGIMLCMKELTDVTGNISIKYAPHEGMLPTMKSLATGKSIRLWYNGNGYIRINTDVLSDKFGVMYEKLGIHQ